MKDLMTLAGLGRDDIGDLMTRATEYVTNIDEGRRHSDELGGRVVATLFFEPSTRTRLSFEQAATFLGADVLTFDTQTSSATKGESLEDTARTIAAIGADLFVVRHTIEDAPQRVSEAARLPVVNGGTGRAEHPTQTLTDVLTLLRRFDSLEGVRMAIVGDVANSRVARGHLMVLPALGIEVTLVGPSSLMPTDIDPQIAVENSLDAVLPDMDVVYMLRVQTERGTMVDDDYRTAYQLNEERASRMRPEAVVMHPGPINRGTEVSDAVADGPRSLITTQVALGVPLRMAVLTSILGGRR